MLKKILIFLGLAMNENERKMRDMIMKARGLKVVGDGCIRSDINDPTVQKNIREMQKKIDLIFFESRGSKESSKSVD